MKKEFKRQKKTFKIEFTKGSVLLWTTILIFTIVWAFILGVFVGKGFLPEKEIRPNKKNKIINKKEENKNTIDFFSFHKQLTSNTYRSENLKNKVVHKNKHKKNLCYSVQIAAFLKEKDAKNMVKAFNLKGYPVYYVKYTKNKKEYYRVRCGKSSSKKEIEDLKNRLIKKEHIKGIIVRCNQ